MTQDEALELYVELEDITRRLRNIRHALGEYIGRDTLDTSPKLRRARVQRIINAVMESDEHQMRMGLPAPNDYPIPSSDGHPPTPAHICVEDDWQ